MTDVENYLKPLLLNRNAETILSQVKGKQYIDYREQWRQASMMELETKFPLHVDIDIIDDCNKRCPMCIQWKNPGFTGKKINLELFNQILHEVCCYDGKSVNIGTNTEPLYDPVFFCDIMKILTGYHPLDCYVHTNGLHLTPQASQMIIDAGVTNIIFSFALLNNPKENDKAIENIKQFYKTMKEQESALPILRAEMIPTSDNQKEMKRVTDELSPIIDMIGFQYLIDVNNLHQNIKNMKHIYIQCNDPWRRVYIDPWGNIYQCCAFTAFNPHMQIGVIQPPYSTTNHVILDAWNSDAAKQNRRNIKQDSISSCHRCMGNFYTIAGNKKG